MSEDMNKFWQELQERAADPAGFAPVTDAEAERRMAEAGEQPMSEEEIAAIVRDATAVGPRGVVDGAEEAQEPEAQPRLRQHQDIEAPQVRYLMKAAAVVVGVLLLVAGVIGTKAMIWPERSEPGANPMRTLKYRDAILIALDPGEQESARNAALGRLSVAARHAIRALQANRAEGGDLGSSADEVLRTLLKAIEAPDIFEDQHFSRVHALTHPVQATLDFIQDPSSPLHERQRRQVELGDQLRLGILALKRVLDTEDGLLKTGARLTLQRRKRQLGQ